MQNSFLVLAWRTEIVARLPAGVILELWIGGRWAAELERLRSYHREHGNLGKRYTDVIHEFVPKYIPRTEKELASMSQSVHW